MRVRNIDPCVVCAKHQDETGYAVLFMQGTFIPKGAIYYGGVRRVDFNVVSNHFVARPRREQIREVPSWADIICRSLYFPQSGETHIVVSQRRWGFPVIP